MEHPAMTLFISGLVLANGIVIALHADGILADDLNQKCLSAFLTVFNVEIMLKVATQRLILTRTMIPGF